MGENTPSVSDIRAVMDASNGSNGFAYPYPMYGNGFGNGFGGDSGWLWFIIILAMMNGGWGFGGFGGNFGGGVGMDVMYPWLSNGQKEIMQNTNNGFDTLQLTNQLTGINSGVQNLSTQLCNSTNDVISSVNNNFANAEISANSRQMANMQQAFNSEIATLNGFNGLQSQLAQCLKKILIKAKEFLYFTKNEAVGTCMA